MNTSSLCAVQAGNCAWVGAAHQRWYIGAAESVLGDAGKCRNAVKDNAMFPPEIFAVKPGIPVNHVPLNRGSTCNNLRKSENIEYTIKNHMT